MYTLYCPAGQPLPSDFVRTGTVEQRLMPSLPQSAHLSFLLVWQHEKAAQPPLEKLSGQQMDVPLLS